MDVAPSDDDSISDAAGLGSQDDDYPLVATQSQSQSQHSSDNPDLDEDLVGSFIPVTEKCQRFNLRKDKESRSWRLGRHPACDIVLPGDKLSNLHCTLRWNGGKGKNSELVLKDKSQNGIWVNNTRLKKGQKYILRSGAEISFGRKPDGLSDFHAYESFPALIHSTGFVFRDIEGQSTRHMLQVCAKYDIGLELGTGAFARVHKCIERATGDEYAVKIIDRSKLRPLPSDEQPVVREISILKQLAEFRHEHVVSLREYFEEEDSIYLILELVRGGDLMKYMQAHSPIPEQHVRRMAAQICHAVAYIHSQGIAHRDLKPENVLLTKADSPDCKVADFGLAKLVGSGTFLKTLCGTPAYLAPEVMLRESPLHGYDNRVDSWSLGVIFYCMLTNKAPFHEPLDPKATHAEQQLYFRTRQVNWHLLRDHHVTDDGANFLRYLLAEDPRNRKDVLRMLDHPWVSALIPSDPQFQRPPWQSSPFASPPTKVDDALVCSQSFENLSLSDAPIPGLNKHAADMSVDRVLDTGMGVKSSASAMSITASASPLKPKEKERQPLSAGAENSAYEFFVLAKTHGIVRRDSDGDGDGNENMPGPSRRPPVPQPIKVPAKRNYSLIAGSSSLSSLTDEDEDEVKESAKKPVVRHTVPKGKGKGVETPLHKRKASAPRRPRRIGAGAAHKDDVDSSADENLDSGRRHPPAKVRRYV